MNIAQIKDQIPDFGRDILLNLESVLSDEGGAGAELRLDLGHSLGQCLASHLNELRKAGVSHEGAQSALRIASVVHAAKSALAISALGR